MIEAILSCDCDSECTDPNSHLRLLTRKGGRDHSAIDRRPLPRITFGGTSSGRALCPQADPLAGRRTGGLDGRGLSASWRHPRRAHEEKRQAQLRRLDP